MERIYHTWDKWECYPAGFFEVKAPKEYTDDDCEKLYRELLEDIPEFTRILNLIITEWPYSCQHNLTNDRMNRIAWMGQASLTYKYRIPARFRGGYHLLNEDQKLAADMAALEAINKWMSLQSYEPMHLNTIQSRTEVDLY